MNDLAGKVAALEQHLDQAIRLEQELSQSLGSQERALLDGAIDRIHTANKALDQVFAGLRRVSDECRMAITELDEELGLVNGPGGAPLGELIETLPDGMASTLAERRNDLKNARKDARRQTARNAAIARTSLDTIASVRGIVGGAVTGGGSNPSPTSRLDTQI